MLRLLRYTLGVWRYLHFFLLYLYNHVRAVCSAVFPFNMAAAGIPAFVEQSSIIW